MNRRDPRVIIVEDDENIRQELARLLETAGYEALSITSFKNSANEIKGLNPDLVLLDVNLPGESGLTICSKIRKTSDVPIIFVTSRNTSMDELDCIVRGGDDYIAKPYQVPILLARIAAVLKRTMTGEDKSAAVLTCRNVTLNMAAGQISSGGRTEELTRNELKILYYLFRREGAIVSRTDLIEYLWDNEVYIDDNSLSVNVTRLRGKLKNIGAEGLIETKRGMGYKV